MPTKPPAETKLTFRLWWRLLAIGAVVYAGYTIWLGGAYRSAEAFAAGECLAVPAPAGPEDIAILPDGRGAVVSAQDRRSKGAEGALWHYDMTSRPGRFTRLTPEGAATPFHPHGISLFPGPDGGTYIQAINHRSAERHTVELYLLDGDNRLRHRGSISSDLFVNPNALIATGPDSFYLTNDRGSGPAWMHRVENILQLARSTVVYHDGRTTRVVAEDIAFANGIALNEDGSRLMVGSTLWRMALLFERDPASGLLRRTGSLALPGGVDNLRADEDGAIWAALHPNAFAFIGHAMNAEKEAPSMVVRIGSDARGATRVQQAFGDPGTLLSGASTGARRGGRLLIGAVFQATIMDCALAPEKLRDID